MRANTSAMEELCRGVENRQQHKEGEGGKDRTDRPNEHHEIMDVLDGIDPETLLLSPIWEML
jgi:hypothetical protein